MFIQKNRYDIAFGFMLIFVFSKQGIITKVGTNDFDIKGFIQKTTEQS